MAVTPSNANTSGLSELMQARIGQDFDGECHLTDDEAQQVISALVTAASAQAKIRGLQREVAVAVAAADHMADRATAAEARADRLAKGMPDLSSVIGWLASGCEPKHAVDELRIYQARINAALQQETQP